MKMIIKGKRQSPQGTAGVKTPPGLNIGETPDGNIILNYRDIVKMKGAIKRIGIGYYPREADKHYGY
jgi:hypothetical protein